MRQLELGALAQVLTPTLIQEAVEATGRGAKRVRKLPPTVVAWLVVAMGLHRGLSASNALRRVMEALGDSLGWGLAELPHSTSITHARDRLGWETVRLIFRKLAGQLDAKHTTASVWRGLKVFALDGTSFLAADTTANEDGFGRPGVTRGNARSAFPQLRCVVLVGAWCHLISEAVFGPFRGMSELRLAEQLLPRLKSGTVILMDRLYFCFPWLAQLSERDVSFVVRMKTGKTAMKPKARKRLKAKRRKRAKKSTQAKVRKVKLLKKGDWLAFLDRPRACKVPGVPARLQIRVIEFSRKGYRPILLATNLLDPDRYPALEVARLYLDRWEGELSYRELKIHMGEKPVRFRSTRPDRVLQEAYGLLIAYNCVRSLMAEAAEEARLEPRQLSFVDCLERIRWAIRDFARATPAQFPGLRARLISDLAHCRLQPKREGRSCERAVKRKMSNYARKRPGRKAATSRYRGRGAA